MQVAASPLKYSEFAIDLHDPHGQHVATLTYLSPEPATCETIHRRFWLVFNMAHEVTGVGTHE